MTDLAELTTIGALGVQDGFSRVRELSLRQIALAGLRISGGVREMPEPESTRRAPRRTRSAGCGIDYWHVGHSTIAPDERLMSRVDMICPLTLPARSRS